MKVGFAGTPMFAAHLLRALVDADISVTLALTQPDRPRGRGQKLAPSPVKELAREHAIPLHQPSSLSTVEAQALLVGHEVDVLVVAAYGLLLPAPILHWPRHGCVNVHASLLPRWRGAAPIQRALLAGDTETGITLMQMDKGLDTGPMLGAVHVPIDERETAATLERKLTVAGSSSLLSYLAALAAGSPPAARPQPAAGATYAGKIDKREAEIDWSEDVVTIDRKVRAFNPVPGAATSWAGERVKVWRAHPVTRMTGAQAPGTVLATDEHAITVACGDGALEIAELHPAGGRRMPAVLFTTGRHVEVGQRFGAVPGSA